MSGEKKVVLEMVERKTNSEDYTFNLVFLDTGEIRQKTRSPEWMARRIFQHELRTAKRKYGETITYDGG